jgi:hypothetical protein
VAHDRNHGSVMSQYVTDPGVTNLAVNQSGVVAHDRNHNSVMIQVASSETERQAMGNA